MSLDDTTRLRHMLEAATQAVTFAQGKTRETLDSDRVLALALVKLAEIVGEAASKVTKELQTANPQIPWPAIIGMRNRLVHGYFDIDLNAVWSTVENDLPSLIAQVEQIIPAND